VTLPRCDRITAQPANGQIWWYSLDMLRPLILVLAAANLAASGCSSTRCGDLEVSDETNAPKLVAFYVLPDEKQMPGDPWTVLFGVESKDANGDLGGGQAEFFLNSETEATKQDLDTVFRQSGVELDATRAEVYMTLRFAENTVDDGAQVRLGLQLVDAQGLRSNCFTLELEFDVFPAAEARLAPIGSVALACRPGNEGGLVR